MEYPQAKGRGGGWPVGPPRRKFSEFSALNHAFTLSVDFECRPMKMLMHLRCSVFNNDLYLIVSK